MKDTLALDSKGETGVTRRQDMERRNQPVPVPWVPEAGAYLLGWFWALDSYREFREGVTLPLPPDRVESWFRMRGIVPRPWEYRLLEEMDYARVSGPSDEYAPKKEVLTADAFDAMFD